jgi:hypothetical protein
MLVPGSVRNAFAEDNLTETVRYRPRIERIPVYLIRRLGLRHGRRDSEQEPIIVLRFLDLTDLADL